MKPSERIAELELQITEEELHHVETPTRPKMSPVGIGLEAIRRYLNEVSPSSSLLERMLHHQQQHASTLLDLRDQMFLMVAEAQSTNPGGPTLLEMRVTLLEGALVSIITALDPSVLEVREPLKETTSAPTSEN